MSDKSETCSTCSCNHNPASALSEILTLREAAEFLRVKVHTLYYLLEHGQIKGRRCGKSYRFLRSDLVAWLACNAKSAA